MQKYLIFLLSLLLFGISCTEKQRKKRLKKSHAVCEFCVDSSDFKQISKKEKEKVISLIDKYFQENFDSYGFNGGFLVAKNGQILYEKYEGFRSVRNNTLIKASTPMHLASVGKVLTATAVFRLIETKKIKLDEKVTTILPLFPYPLISVRMLLNHRSGLPKYANFSEPDTIWGKTKILHNNDILHLLAKHQFPLDFIPDTKFVYNNTNYAILALLVEKIHGKTFKESMWDLVFEPLGMKNSFVFTLEEDKYKVSQSYSTQFKLQVFDNLDAVYGDKNIYSTPRDLLKYDLAMQKNDFVSKKLKKEIFKGYSYEKPGVNNYGLGIRLKEWNNGQKLFFHNGWWHGSRSSYVTMKDEGVTIIALTNANSRKVYGISRLSSIFGDYPFSLDENSEEESKEIELVLPMPSTEKIRKPDSIQTKNDVLKK